MLQVDPRLAELPGCSTEQLESLARSIESKKQRLEADINAYMKQKQHELDMYQHELIAQYREMECGETNEAANRNQRPADSHDSNAPSDHALPSPAQSPEMPAESSKREEKAKRTKVHKREKELFGLVTPIFLPLLDASETSKEKEKKKRHKKKDPADGSSPPKQAKSESSTGDVEEIQRESGSSSHYSDKMETEGGSNRKEPQKENQPPESAKKSKRPTIKKSSLRHSGEKRRRKRVSLVIDGQTVLPADQVAEPQLMSPSETTASSASNSTVSLEDTIDPRLMGGDDAPIHISHQDPVHHSLDLPSRLPSASPTKHTGHTLPDSPRHSPICQSPPSHTHLEYEPPQSTTRTYLDPSPPSDPTTIPRHASAAPIYADAPELANEPEEEFSTYVGGISGSGVDDVDQTGSLGYPSSLGASYMESYMQSRPLSVRMAAAEKAGLSEGERRRLVNGREREEQEKKEREQRQREQRSDRDDDDMDIIGSMEDF
ncbi:uncharacterized protein N0V89_004436 [Didymosphaeria variabile]|uniref:Uncharacterized protein n=1 Tax=Didymosphaeria variabile TaxID=1932322 RepID=A0A9W8XS59_9PLEO|nr:uncharacterized protein N0V89_004436 [Didymosphaeria variabile]KAJ4356403.1 hypothetical protein N0V89_004436 [Didymosphaeria variabile]